ncbi:carboxypeptidase Taq [Stella humosa]|uniref:Metal-dependent carboxypeptidase n=1 Tax=Stella humosa TaxID=94 RepID=A0A3N1L8U5_9PROT|nr:carboxypeptidase M32 [Stella humosa]ROP91113.1 carboxypeptidase Taq [Stella humosa]BBK34535.1 carboxypeptidase M32 [Stella humosa]
MNAQARLFDRIRRISILGEATGMLHWDAAAVMPDGGAPARAEQLATLRELSHAMLTATETADLLADAEAAETDPSALARIGLARRRWHRATAVPGDLVAALSRAGSRCETAWRQARADDDFATVLPFLAEVVARTRDEAAALGQALNLAPYDALLDGYEPGLTAADCTGVFDRLEAFLPDLLGQAIEVQATRPEPIPLEGPFPIADQAGLARRLMVALGFDFHHGRLDVSAHPFCGGIPDDVRITTRYDEADFLKALMGVLHETGHALYERGLPAALRHQPAGEARGMAVHESQSLIVEMQACRSREFTGWMAPLAQAAFGGAGPAWSPDNIRRLVTRVARGLIRVDANEIAYPLHVILRFRLERAILSGELALADLPAAWNDGMAASVGVRPDSDREGCLQDIHWYDGAFGYFPTYTFGALMAAQLFAAASAAVPALQDRLASGDFAPLQGWLATNVHAHGATLSWDEILRRATGRPLDVDLFRRHLERRYLGD